VNPITDTITLDHRTKFLTRRVRAVMRAFNKNRNYFSDTPNITWDDSFVPHELYEDPETELESLDGKESQRVQKEKHKASGRMESSLMFDIADDSEGETSADEDEPPAKRFKRKNSIDDVGIIPIPPCQQCTSSQKECKPNGWSAACKNCRKARQTCSLSKALRDDKGKAKETAEDNEKPDDTEKSKTQRLRLREIHPYAGTKSILHHRSIEDEDVDQLDEVPAKASPKKKVSTTTNDSFIPYNPKVCP
jgi:hypothetical protein